MEWPSWARVPAPQALEANPAKNNTMAQDSELSPNPESHIFFKPHFGWKKPVRRSWGHSGAARQLMDMVLCLVWLMPQKHCIAEAKQRKTLENNWVRNYYMPDLERIIVAGEDNAYYFGMERVTTCIPPFATEPWHCPTWMKLDQGLTALLKPATCAGWIDFEVGTPVPGVFDCQHQVAMNTKGKLTFEFCWP